MAQSHEIGSSRKPRHLAFLALATPALSHEEQGRKPADLVIVVLKIKRHKTLKTKNEASQSQQKSLNRNSHLPANGKQSPVNMRQTKIH